jgi:hypothetical protein
VHGKLHGWAWEGVHLGAGGNHGGRTARAAWHGAREARRCLNRALDRDVAVTANMSSYHGAPRPARVRAAPRTDVRRKAGEPRGAWASRHRGEREPGEGVQPRLEVASGGARARRRGASCGAKRGWLNLFCCASI